MDVDRELDEILHDKLGALAHCALNSRMWRTLFESRHGRSDSGPPKQMVGFYVIIQLSIVAIKTAIIVAILM